MNRKLAFAGGCVGLAMSLPLIRLLDLDGQHALLTAGWSFFVGAALTGPLEQSLLGASSGIWHSVPGRWLIGRVAGFAVILLLAGPAWYAVRLGFNVLADWLYAQGMRTSAPGSYHLFDWPVAAWIAWRLRTPVKVIIGKSTRKPRAWYRSFTMGRGGSAGFASIVEEWANRWRPGMIFLGHSLHDRSWPVGIRDDRMLMTLAGNGGGKGLTAIIPNLLTYRGSVFINDTKEQNALVTARARRAMGQNVFVLAPFANKTAHLNPLAGPDPEAPDYVERIKGIVEALVIAGEGKDRIWSDWAKIVIEGLIDLEIRHGGEEECDDAQ